MLHPFVFNSFCPGHGIPGIVYASVIACWEQSVQKSSCEHFARCQGVSIYGIQTVVGLPVTSSIGSIILGMYRALDVSKNADLVGRMRNSFGGYNPTPR